MNLSAVLALTGGDATDAWKRNLAWFRIFALMHVAVRTFLTLGGLREDYQGWYVQTGQLLMVVCLGGLLPPIRTLAVRVAALLLAAEIAVTLPITANHVFLEFICLGLLALLDESQDPEGELLLRALRWITILFFFYTGLQKVLYGRYFDGQFLAYVTATEDRFAVFFRHLMPAAEFARLRAEGEVEAVSRIGTGPYRVDSIVFLIVSNSVYLFEMLAPVLLIVRKTRAAAVVATIAFVFGIEAGAREVMFGAFMIGLLLLFLPGTWNKKVFPVYAAIYAYLIADTLNLVPMFEYYL